MICSAFVCVEFRVYSACGVVDLVLYSVLVYGVCSRLLFACLCLLLCDPVRLSVVVVVVLFLLFATVSYAVLVYVFFVLTALRLMTV